MLLLLLLLLLLMLMLMLMLLLLMLLMLNNKMKPPDCHVGLAARVESYRNFVSADRMTTWTSHHNARARVSPGAVDIAEVGCCAVKVCQL